jgi:hypothetical protein
MQHTTTLHDAMMHGQMAIVSMYYIYYSHDYRIRTTFLANSYILNSYTIVSTATAHSTTISILAQHSAL